MNPLPRFLVMGLFVILAALVALLAMSAWRGGRSMRSEHEAAIAAGVAPPEPAKAAATPTKALMISQRFALALALVALGLTLTLMLSLAFRPGRALDSLSPFSQARGEVGTLARLAESSVAQEEELSRERGVRRLAQEDAELNQQLLTRSLEEKVRLGHDLHDGIIQSLYAAGLTLESVRTIVQSDPKEADHRIEEIRSRLNGTIRDVRAYITGLDPENLRLAGFGHAVNTVLDELRSGRDTRFDVKIDDVAAAQLSAGQATEALQIIREAVSNALRHGGASLITLRVHQGDREVCLLVQDNGIGFEEASRRAGGHGLGNMGARAGRMGATLRVSSVPGEGTRIVATLPISNPASS
ncbi:MAG: sensor histidine kinase [Opitutus sp.]